MNKENSMNPDKVFIELLQREQNGYEKGMVRTLRHDSDGQIFIQNCYNRYR